MWRKPLGVTLDHFIFKSCWVEVNKLFTGTIFQAGFVDLPANPFIENMYTLTGSLF